MEADSAFITDQASRADRAERQTGRSSAAAAAATAAAARNVFYTIYTYSFYHTRSEKVFVVFGCQDTGESYACCGGADAPCYPLRTVSMFVIISHVDLPAIEELDCVCVTTVSSNRTVHQVILGCCWVMLQKAPLAIDLLDEPNPVSG